jgi:hypothetical protein
MIVSLLLLWLLKPDRVGSILYFFNLLLQTDVQGPSTEECQDFFDMPLPCVRDLWQPVSDRDWKKLYQENNDSRRLKGRHGLTFRHLIMLRRSSLYGEKMIDSSDTADEIAEWCEKVDDLSMLLWISITIEGAGQAPGISGIF